MTTPDTNNHADSRDMYVVHNTFRREFRALPDLVRGVEAGDTGQAAVVADHVDTLIGFLHAHHLSEDAVVWPKLIERGAGESAGVVADMEAQHGAIDHALETAAGRVAAWRETPESAPRELAETALRELLPPLEGHLAHEETHALPLVDRYLTQDEWLEAANGTMAKLAPEQYPLLFGMMLHEIDPELSAVLEAVLPAEVFAAMTAAGPPAYAEHRARLYPQAATAADGQPSRT